MSSESLLRWNTERAQALDEIQNAVIAVGGQRPGRRYATQQVNQAYLILLSSQFQGFCRDLHTEAVDFIVRNMQPTTLQLVVRARLVDGRKLDTGNPNPGNLGSDFGRFGMAFWTEVDVIDSRNPKRRKALESMNTWRNAIAHQDFDPAKIGKATLLLKQVWRWRTICGGLAASFDKVVRNQLTAQIGHAPW